MGAPINLKDLTIRIEDATSLTGKVNHAMGYAMGVATLTVDTFTTEVPVGSRVEFSAQPGVIYTVTASSGTPATSITITPVLAASVADNEDIAVGPNFIDVTIGEGNAEWTEKQNVEYIKDRGILDSTREGDDEPMEVTLDFRFEKITGTSTDVLPTVEDAIKFRGPAANWVATNADTCSSPRTVNISILETPPCSGVENQLFVFPDFAWEQLAHDFKAGTVKMTGKCNAVEPTVSRNV